MQIDSLSGDGSKSLAVISRGLDRYVAEISAECKQHMFPETATWQDGSSSIENSVRSSEFSSPTVKLPPTPPTGKVKSFCSRSRKEELAGEILCAQADSIAKAERNSSKGSSG